MLIFPNVAMNEDELVLVFSCQSTQLEVKFLLQKQIILVMTYIFQGVLVSSLLAVGHKNKMILYWGIKNLDSIFL